MGRFTWLTTSIFFGPFADNLMHKKHVSSSTQVFIVREDVLQVSSNKDTCAIDLFANAEKLIYFCGRCSTGGQNS